MDELLVVRQVIWGGDEDVIQVDNYLACQDKVFKYGVHHRLEGTGGIGESEEHDGRFEESSVCFESGFPLVSFFDMYVIEPFSDVDF